MPLPRTEIEGQGVVWAQTLQRVSGVVASNDFTDAKQHKTKTSWKKVSQKAIMAKTMTKSSSSS